MSTGHLSLLTTHLTQTYCREKYLPDTLNNYLNETIKDVLGVAYAIYDDFKDHGFVDKILDIQKSMRSLCKYSITNITYLLAARWL